MIPTNTNFDTKNASLAKIPLYLIKFDGEIIDYCNYSPTTTVNDVVKDYLGSISGLSQRITPEEGKSSISSVAFELIDEDDEITALIATDTDALFQGRKVEVLAGYLGMAEADLLTIHTGQLSNYSESQIGKYRFDVSDYQKAMQRKIFRGAGTTSVSFSGNPLTMLLAWMTSTGLGTNGDYDYYPAVNGLGIDADVIDIAGIEVIRDNYYPGTAYYMAFDDIDEPVVAKTFFESQIYKVLNLYPRVRGSGIIGLTPYKPPLPSIGTTPSFTQDDIVDNPKWSGNLEALINEVQVKSDWDGDDFDLDQFYIDATSLTNRKGGKKTIVIQSKGLKIDHAPRSIVTDATSAIQRRVNSIFARYATPPIMVSFKAFFSKWLAEAGDIASFSYDLLPDIYAGTRGLSLVSMEVISRIVDWKNGNVKIKLLDTGFAKDPYQAISPTMTITSGTSSTEFEVSSADAEKYENFTTPVVDIMNAKMSRQITAKAISDISGTTITIADMGQTPSVGWIVVFSDYDNVTTEQKKWGYIADASDDLGTANDNAHLIVP